MKTKLELAKQRKAKKQQDSNDIKALVAEIKRFNELVNEKQEIDLSKLQSQLKQLPELVSEPLSESLDRFTDQLAVALHSIDLKKQKALDLSGLISAVKESNKEVDLLPVVKAIKEASSKTAKSQNASDYLPYRRVVKLGSRFFFDDNMTSSGGGGGGGSSSASIDTTGLATEAKQDDIITALGAPDTTVIDPRTGYALSNKSDDGTYKYYGFEDASGNWYIQRKTIADNTTVFVKGASAYATAWANRASQSYNTFDNTFDPVVGSVITSATTVRTNQYIDQDPRIQQALNQIYATYSATVSVDDKKKALLKFGSRTTVGTGWETLMTTVGTETGETFVSGNDIDTIVGGSGDTGTVNVEYHTISGGNTTFGVQEATLTGTTPVTLSTPAFRVSRVYNTGSTTLTGPVYVYEDNTGRDNDKTHITVPAGENQTQKASTTISANDYWIISNFSLSVLSKTTKYAEGRLEIKPVTQSYWLPITQTITATDTTGTTIYKSEPYLIVPANYDVRIAVKTNTNAVDVAGGFSGYLAN